jgi:Protein of unknown function (DUF2026)
LSGLQITLKEYNRIYQVARGVIEDIGHSEKACMFFAIFGAMMLNKHFKIPARAVAGGFALRVSEAPEIAFFGQMAEDRLVMSTEGFHMWVQTASHIIDFMAPVYPEAFAQAEQKLIIPRKMFQRPISTEAASMDDLSSPGDFYTLPDPELTESLIDGFLGRASGADLLSVADTWFGGRRRKQVKSMAMQDDQGKVYQLDLPRTTAIGSW